MLGSHSVRIVEAEALGHGAANCLSLDVFQSSLPASAASLSALKRELGRTTVDLALVTDIIRVDPSLAFQVFAFAGVDLRAESHCSLANAVVLAGVSQMLRMLRRIEAADFSTDYPSSALWLHSCLTAALAQCLARLLGNLDPEQAYLAGLVHDIGKLPIEALGQASGEARPIDSGQHVRVGSWLADEWRIPAFLREVIAHHHGPVDYLSAQPLLATVAVANRFCHAFGVVADNDPCEVVDVDVLQGILATRLPGIDKRLRARAIEALESEFLSWAQSPTGLPTPRILSKYKGGIQ